MRQRKRVYVYLEDYEKIIAWAESRKAAGRFRDPELRADFPLFLEQYLMEKDQTKRSIGMAICRNCGSNDVQYEKGYTTVFRCQRCNRVDTKQDFDWR